MQVGVTEEYLLHPPALQVGRKVFNLGLQQLAAEVHAEVKR